MMSPSVRPISTDFLQPGQISFWSFFPFSRCARSHRTQTDVTHEHQPRDTNTRKTRVVVSAFSVQGKKEKFLVNRKLKIHNSEKLFCTATRTVIYDCVSVRILRFTSCVSTTLGRLFCFAATSNSQRTLEDIFLCLHQVQR